MSKNALQITLNYRVSLLLLFWHVVWLSYVKSPSLISAIAIKMRSTSDWSCCASDSLESLTGSLLSSQWSINRVYGISLASLPVSFIIVTFPIKSVVYLPLLSSHSPSRPSCEILIQGKKLPSITYSEYVSTSCLLWAPTMSAFLHHTCHLALSPRQWMHRLCKNIYVSAPLPS